LSSNPINDGSHTLADLERAAAEGVDIGFRDYFRIGLPVTLATLALGSAWLWILS